MAPATNFYCPNTDRHRTTDGTTGTLAGRHGQQTQKKAEYRWGGIKLGGVQKRFGRTNGTCVELKAEAATMLKKLLCRERDSNPHSHFWPRDFKSLVSTNSTIAASHACFAVAKLSLFLLTAKCLAEIIACRRRPHRQAQTHRRARGGGKACLWLPAVPFQVIAPVGRCLARLAVAYLFGLFRIENHAQRLVVVEVVPHPVEQHHHLVSHSED